MAVRAIHTGLIFRVIVRAIHLGRSMPFGVYVSHVACLDESDSATSRQGIANVDRIWRGIPAWMSPIPLHLDRV